VSHRLRLLGVALALLALAGCSALRGPAEPQASEEERMAYARALATLVDDPEGTAVALQDFLQAYPESPLADDALMRLGDLAADRGDADAALGFYGDVVRQYPSGDRADVARVEIARLLLAAGDPAAAAERMQGVRLSRLSSAERRVAYRVLAVSAADPVERLRWLARVRASETDGEAVEQVDREIDELISQLDGPDLMRAADLVGREVPAARVLLAAADLALDRGDLEAARQAARRAERLPLAPDYASRLTTVTERLRLREAGPAEDTLLPSFAEAAERGVPSTGEASGVIGVVLPLSGPFARFGEESLQGVLLAAGVFGAEAESPRVRVLVRDSAGRPDRAAQAVRELDAAGAVAIVGPLLSGESESAAAAAEAAGVPLLALTARPEVGATRPHVFRIRTMPKEEVENLVTHAVESLGAQRFAILYPRDAYGRGLRQLFWEAVEEHGGRVVGVASYEPDATDFAQPIRSLVGYTLLTAAEKKALKERDDMERRARRLPTEEAAALREEARALTGPEGEPLPPIVDFDALFIPESHEKVVLIAPQLAFHEANGTVLLGPNGWYHPDLLRIAGEHVEGARFTAHFYPESDLPFVQRFTERYARAYTAAPDVFAAQAYDATTLVLIQLARGRESREALREGLLAVQGYPGVTGVLTMRADGNARKRPFLLAVDHGRITPVE
jgi:ABC-type branched-subunit amino acid transport system substrate-binding protein